MLDVHAPHAPVHGWRDIVVHLLTITVGLLIALGLEATVEAAHHHEVAAQARENIAHELDANLAHAADNVARLQQSIDALDATLQAARLRRDDKSAAGDANVQASWTNFESSAWLTARESGALAHMPLDEVQRYAGLYAAQDMLQLEKNEAIRLLLSTVAPLLIEDTPEHASSADLRLMMQRSADAKMQLVGLKQLVEGLHRDYAKAAAHAHAPASAASGAAVPASTR